MDRAVEIGDFFNETDSDTERQVIGICATKDPPVVISRPYKNAADSDDEDDGSESTEEEYCMAYAKKRHDSRKAWWSKGYHEYDVREIYRLTTLQLVQALETGKHTTTGTKQELRWRMMSINGLCEVPSDIESGPDEDEAAETTNKEATNQEEEEESDCPILTILSSSDTSDSFSDSSDSEDDTISAVVTKRKRKSKRKQSKRKQSKCEQSKQRNKNAVISDDSGDADYPPSPCFKRR